jgi:hypothetical protein
MNNDFLSTRTSNIRALFKRSYKVATTEVARD